ncbi:MAG: DNA polymerase III subunit gamma/tau [Prevotellaceae bacterium]|jgi:DNA polymerase-3 subunit gamma/tau|nr:DNA polymerase III subunit gamma/tau [Prevotellaceae bacterium]
MESFVVSARKYRPLTFESVVGQGKIGVTLKNAIKREQLAHAYLFCGPRGVGKTTCARIFAKIINCLTLTDNLEACGKCESCRSFAENRSYSIHELDAASNNSVEDIRLLNEKVRVPPQIGKYSVYIIDEVHMLSSSAFNAFLKTLEEPPAHAIFILATTEKHKIIPTILSRCQIYDFSRITVPDIVKHLTGIAAKEGVQAEPAALNVIAQKADGAMRDALSIYDQVVAFCDDNITYAGVIENLNVLDYEYYFKLTEHFLQHRFADTLLVFDEVLAKGFDAQYFVAGLSIHFRNLLVCKEPRTVSLLEVGDVIAEHYKTQAAQVPEEFLFEALQLTNACEMAYKSSGNPRLLIELTLVRLSNIGAEKKNDDSEIEEGDPVIASAAASSSSSVAATIASATVQPSVIPAAPKSFSLKEAIAKQTVVEEKIVEQSHECEPFTQEQLEVAWGELVIHVANKPRLANALRSATPILKDSFVISFSVVNEAQREWMQKNMAEEILNFLSKALHNHSLQLEVAVVEEVQPNGDTQLYMPSEKFRHLTEKYPQVQDLKQTFKLDVK